MAIQTHLCKYDGDRGWKKLCSSHLSLSHCGFDVRPLDLSLPPVALCTLRPVDFHLHSQGSSSIHALTQTVSLCSGHPLFLCPTIHSVAPCQSPPTTHITTDPSVHQVTHLYILQHPRPINLFIPPSSIHPSIIYFFIYLSGYLTIHCTNYQSMHSPLHPPIHSSIHTYSTSTYSNHLYIHRVTHPSL